MHINRGRAKVSVIIEHARHLTTTGRTELIKRVATQAPRRYVKGNHASRRRYTWFHVDRSYWYAQCSRADEDAVSQAMFDTDGGVYVTAELYLKLPSDPHDDKVPA
jgi:hypothetical protein